MNDVVDALSDLDVSDAIAGGAILLFCITILIWAAHITL